MSEEVNDLPDPRMQAIRREAQQWVVRLASRGADTHDAQAFKRWCARSSAHASAFAQARTVWQDLRPAAQRVQRAEAAQAARREAGRFGRRALLGTALAGTAAWLVLRPPLGLWPAVTELAADLRTGTGEQREWVTAEGIVVQLNTRTRIDRRGAEGGVARLELLEGEAEIRTDLDAAAPAVQVRAGDGLISAQRARFNVRFIDGEVCVTCLAGRVDVRRDEAGSTSVDVDRQLVYARAQPAIARRADAGAVSAWRRRQLVFDQTPLAEVVAEVNRYRPGRLILTDAAVGRKRVQASFSIDRLDDVIALVRDVYRLDVTSLPGGIVLLGSA